MTIKVIGWNALMNMHMQGSQLNTDYKACGSNFNVLGQNSV